MTDESPPPPPSGLPGYVQDGIEARSPGELRAVADWVKELAAHKEREVAAELERPPEEDGDVAGTNRYDADELAADVGEDAPDLDDADGTVFLYWIRTHCNRDNCSSCPHGPYPYLKYRVGDAVRTRYGKTVADTLGVTPPK
jgi:hypothetical protein